MYGCDKPGRPRYGQMKGGQRQRQRNQRFRQPAHRQRRPTFKKATRPKRKPKAPKQQVKQEQADYDYNSPSTKTEPPSTTNSTTSSPTVKTPDSQPDSSDYSDYGDEAKTETKTPDTSGTDYFDDNLTESDDESDYDDYGGETKVKTPDKKTSTNIFKAKYPKANKKCKKACSAAGLKCKEIEGASPNKRGKIPACCQDPTGTCQTPSEGRDAHELKRKLRFFHDSNL